MAGDFSIMEPALCRQYVTRPLPPPNASDSTSRGSASGNASPDDGASDDGDSVLSVSQLVSGLNALVEDAYDRVEVEGELSNFSRAASGHCYFTLKDADAQISCVMWRHLTKYVYFEPEDGMQVRVRGNASVYERRGDLQIMARSMRRAGKGAQQEAYEQLKRKLRDEGLFAAERKQALPAFPETIGVVTSGEGAALQDILSVLKRRFPPAQVVLCPVPVQGVEAPAAIAEAVERFNAAPDGHAQRCDVLIVGRGGGSAEDLWAFNEEVVARAVAASALPVVSAVGHESDVSITDFVADERAATPSMAAEIVVPDRDDLETRVQALHDRLQGCVTDQLREARQRVRRLTESRAFHAPVRRLEQHQQRVDDLVRRLQRAGPQVVEHHRTRLERLQGRLRAVDPEQPLRRGYVRVERDGTPVTSSGTLAAGDRVALRFADGVRSAEIVPEASGTAPNTAEADPTDADPAEETTDGPGADADAATADRSAADAEGAPTDQGEA
jgi:exodeoxyribonuclease VII large subunit